MQPEFKVGEFATVWWTWWESLQPSWRTQDSWPLSHHVPLDEDWSGLHRGGINGLFIVLMCLSWWVSKDLSPKELEVFQEAKSDVAWVLKQVMGSFVSNCPPLKRPAEDGDETSITKRQRL
jgi:hypothetical protein